MPVFVSYSSRDRALLEGLLAALRRAREQVWLDEELTGGETWWRTILEQIRGCDVFVVALSKNMLESKACQAELRYAQDLGKPVLPVQVGPLDNLRINPLAQMQVIDFRDPGVQTGIELISSVHARRAMSPPLPDPLPEEPPIPFAYLMRLASTLSGPSLSAQQQMTLVAELKAGLEEDGDDMSARRDITQLLCMLRDRSDVTWRTRTEVEAVLASLQGSESSGSSASRSAVPGGAPAPARGPMPGGGPVAASGPVPVGPPAGFVGPMPPPGPPGYGGRAASGGGAQPPNRTGRWLWVGGGIAAALIAVVAVVAVVTLSGDDPTPSPPAAMPTVSPTAKNTLLLTTGEIEAILGGSDLAPGKIRDEMQTETSPVSDPDCAGPQYSALKAVYEGSGYSGVSYQAFSSPEGSDAEYSFAEQAVVVYPSADQADAFLRSSAETWKGCAGRTITVTAADGKTFSWTFDDVTESDSQIAQMETQEGMGGYGCEHVIRSVSNVIIETGACNDRISDEATRMADRMAAKAPR